MFRGADESYLHPRKNIIRILVGMSAMFRITQGCKWDCVSQYFQAHTERKICVCLSSYHWIFKIYLSERIFDADFIYCVKYLTKKHRVSAVTWWLSQYLTVKSARQAYVCVQYVCISMYLFTVSFFMDSCSHSICLQPAAYMRGVISNAFPPIQTPFSLASSLHFCLSNQASWLKSQRKKKGGGGE